MGWVTEQEEGSGGAGGEGVENLKDTKASSYLEVEK